MANSPFFVPQKEIDLIDAFNEELIDEIVGQYVDIYKVSVENTEENIYGEKHTYIPKPNGNLQIEQMMGKILNKLDNVGTNSQTGVAPVEVDIQREISIAMVDQNAVKSQEFKGKVKNKKNQLRALRHKRMYNKQRNK